MSSSPWVDDKFRVIAPDLLIDKPSRLEIGGAWFSLIPAGPAHTPEDLMVLSEADGVLFAGDLMFAGRIPFVGSADTRGWIKAIEDLIARNPKIIVGGHGPASTQAAKELVTLPIDTRL
jgi:glyoxylase-like metal-dependent hydrolase (beta-lactamase superfamily II)